MFSSCCGCTNKKPNKKALNDENTDSNDDSPANIDKDNVENRTDDCVEIRLKDRDAVETTTTEDVVISQEPTNEREVLPVVEVDTQIGMKMSLSHYCVCI